MASPRCFAAVTAISNRSFTFACPVKSEKSDGRSVISNAASGFVNTSEIIRSATLINAEIVGRSGQLGEIVAGAFADLLVVDGDPTSDLGVFQDDGARIPAIMKGGRFVKNAL